MRIIFITVTAAIIVMIIIFAGCKGDGGTAPSYDSSPTATARASVDFPSPGQLVDFSDAGSLDPDGGAIVKYEWDWNNDGTFDQSGTDIEHSWAEQGEYFVQFRVTDDEGSTDTLDRPLEINVSSGELVWAKHAGGEGDDYSLAIASLTDGSTVVTGYTRDGAVFGQDEPNETTIEGRSDMFVAKYDASGNLQWVKSAEGSNGSSHGYAVTGLSDGSVVVAGTFEWIVTFGAGEQNEVTVEADWGRYEDMFVAEYGPSGEFEWVKTAGHVGTDEPFSITALWDDSVVITGFYSSAITFEEGEPNETTLWADGTVYVFIARYDSDGEFMWATDAEGPGLQVGYSIARLSDNSVVVVGYYLGTAIFGAGEPNMTTLESEYNIPDAFIARYDNDGSLLWVKVAASAGSQSACSEYVRLTSLSDNSVVLTGCFTNTSVFDEGGPNETALVSAGEEDIFVARYDSTGQLMWVKGAGGPYRDVGMSIASLDDDSIVLTGWFEGEAVFAEGESNRTVLVSGANSDVFIARYASDGSLIRAKSAGGPWGDRGYAITADSDNNISLTGWYGDCATFGTGDPNETILYPYGKADIFIARYRP
jgi:hypothetical protein